MTKKSKSLTQDQLYELQWSNDWKIAEKTTALIEVLKESSYPKDHYEEIEALIEKKYNIVGAQMILDEVEE